MREAKQSRKSNPYSLKFPQIKDKVSAVSALPASKGIKL